MGGPAYDITDTVLAYKARVPASKLILGVPYYGRAWSTNSDLIHATNTSGTKYGASATVIYATGSASCREHGKRYDTPRAHGPGRLPHARTARPRYGCVTSWRQLYLR